jgi:putative redox protein
MVKTRSLEAPYRTLVTNGKTQVPADTRKDGRGGEQGLRPHELLEAAVAACMNIGVRLEAEARGLGPVAVRTAVQLDRARPGVASFRFRCRVDGALDAAQRAALERTARGCAVGQTLQRAIELVEDGGLELEP